jgi:mannose-6-phosphate isomerase-like protein (cupin superfamily)
VAYLRLKQYKRCSWHRHDTAWNRFYVLNGSLVIVTDIGETVLNAGEEMDVAPGVHHEFRTPDMPAGIIEVAYTKYNPYDIIRESLGGDLNTK